MATNEVIECSKALVDKKWKIAFVESASAGRMSYEFSTVPDSGKILLGGMVCYDASLKEDILNIPHEMIENFTPESPQVTREMAVNFCKFAEADVCVAVTGLTTSGGSETAEKPVGTIFIHIIMPNRHIAKRFEFQGNSEEIVSQAIDATAFTLRKELTLQ